MSNESFERGRRYERELAQLNVNKTDQSTDFEAGYQKGIEFGQNWVVYLLSTSKDEWVRIAKDAVDKQDWDAVTWASDHAAKLEAYVDRLQRELGKNRE